jgi:hypothetical protein
MPLHSWRLSSIEIMSDHSDPLTPTRNALDTLADVPLDELRRLAGQLDAEQRIVKSLIRDRARRPERGLGIVGAEDS